MPPGPSKLDDFERVIDDILRADLDAPTRQRHTVSGSTTRLIDEHGMREVSYAVVRRYVADRKPKFAVAVPSLDATQNVGALRPVADPV